METVLAAAIVLGIIAGVALVMYWPAMVRVRRALAYQAKKAADYRAENDVLHRTLRMYEEAIANRDHRLGALRQQVERLQAEAGQ